MTSEKKKHIGSDAFAELTEFDETYDARATRVAGDPAPGAPGAPGVDSADLEQRYAGLIEVSTALNATLELTDLLNTIVDGIIRVTGCERGFLMLRESDGSFFKYIGRTRDRAEWDESDAREISRTLVKRVVESYEPFIESDLTRLDDLKDVGSIHEQAIRSAICLPLLYKGSLIGIIYADSGFVVPQFGESHATILRAFAAQAALAIENARRHGELRTRSNVLEEQNLSLRQQLGKEITYVGMVSKNKRMRETFEAVEKIASHDINVLIQGESGTGKELLARAIHERSPRAENRFEAVNCGGIPAGLVESILFGHRKGSFTGATRDKPGLFELADGGTLFLDEIGDMPLEIQPALLRVLQEGEFVRVGEEERVRKVDVRVIAATNLHLENAVAEGRFRKDLFFRLNVARLDLPPLRDRREDIVPLADHFLARYAEEKKQPLPKLSRDAREYLIEHLWAGNVRELKSAIEWGIVFQDTDHVIQAEVLTKFFRRDYDSETENIEEVTGSLREKVAGFEENVIRRTLEEHANNVTAAAKVLDISRQQLHNKIRKFRISNRSE